MFTRSGSRSAYARGLHGGRNGAGRPGGRAPVTAEVLEGRVLLSAADQLLDGFSDHGQTLLRSGDAASR